MQKMGVFPNKAKPNQTWAQEGRLWHLKFEPFLVGPFWGTKYNRQVADEESAFCSIVSSMHLMYMQA